MSKKITFQNISKQFEGAESFTALQQVNFEIKAGEIAALFGPSGSGKSTILNIASGLDTASTGLVMIGDVNLTDLGPGERAMFRRQHVGFVFQNYNLFPSLTVIENVEMICLLNNMNEKLAREKALHALEKVGLSDRQSQFPNRLSGGQQQRVAVARAIASSPEVLFADEPTANLDSKTALSLIDLFFDLNRLHGTTILFATHDSNILQRVPKKIQVKDGSITPS